MINWKEISNLLIDSHQEEGDGLVKLYPHSEGDSIVNMSNENFILEVEGKELRPKKVRKFLWEQRKNRALKRKNAVLWSSYIEEEDKSYVGVGALTSPEAADRLKGFRDGKV
tara:strand:+ start:229 stop:564 length:336 start_codon:yes stop_codon:yes gene_type:complete